MAIDGEIKTVEKLPNLNQTPDMELLFTLLILHISETLSHVVAISVSYIVDRAKY